MNEFQSGMTVTIRIVNFMTTDSLHEDYFDLSS